MGNGNFKDEQHRNYVPKSAKPTIELMMARAFQSVLRGRADTGSVRMDWTTPEIAKEPVIVALDD